MRGIQGPFLVVYAGLARLFLVNLIKARLSLSFLDRKGVVELARGEVPSV